MFKHRIAFIAMAFLLFSSSTILRAYAVTDQDLGMSADASVIVARSLLNQTRILFFIGLGAVTFFFLFAILKGGQRKLEYA